LGKVKIEHHLAGGGLFPWGDEKIWDALQAEDVAGSGYCGGVKF
jgi:hypothetical protein